jgi:hypothetical protein
MASDIADPISTAIAVPARRQRKPATEPKPEKRSKQRQAAQAAESWGFVPDNAAPPEPETYGEAILAAQMHPSPMSVQEHQLRVAAGWSPPASNLRLRDRTV